MTNDTGLDIHVYVAPMRPVPNPAAEAAGVTPMWSPCSSTLITGETEALLVDALITYDQADALAEWIKGFGKKLVGVLFTHGHSDHTFGLTRLREHFPGLRGLATRGVLERTRFEKATMGPYWQSVFGDQVPGDPVLPELLEGDSISLDGHRLSVLDLGQGDIEDSTILYVPQLDAVVAGDICYNQVHMMTAFTDDEKREAWIANLDRIAAMNPRIVVSGHKRVDAPDTPDTIEQSKQYLRDWGRVAAEQETAEGIFGEMMKLHGDRDNPYTLLLCAQLTVQNRG
ncbi:MBL fold metallo-hydrolase [Streptomyces sp. NPDC091217]|uniref:MBL fold metallo-hydrolase n=1 Tax=Streptomyces sp. NPDC091217 TaxID=3365975 RepID=UPI003810ECFE